MRNRNIAHTSLWVLLPLLGWGGCSEFRKVEKSGDWQKQYEAAINYYEKRDYHRSSLLLEQIRPIVRGLPEGEKSELMLAYCQYHNKTYLLAANQFRLFYETYGRSELSEEAFFMYAYSLYALSPMYTLDQQSGIQAMNVMQSFINRYPNSQFLEEATQVIRTCQRRLEKKNYKNAELYLKLGRYKAALTAFSSFKEHFPDSKYLENIAFLKVKAQFKLASESLYHLKKERFDATIQLYKKLADNYPNSIYLAEAEKYYVKSVNELNKKNYKL